MYVLSFKVQVLLARLHCITIRQYRFQLSVHRAAIKITKSKTAKTLSNTCATMLLALFAYGGVVWGKC
jgi:hypothetical protein